MPKFRIAVCHAQKCLEQIDELGITKYWTGDAYVWDVSTLDENGCSDSLIFDSEVAAQAYIHARGCDPTITKGHRGTGATRM